jgi:hypothetical protein
MALTKPKLSQNIDTDISVFSDPILVLHQGSGAADIDVGFLMNRSNGLTSNAAVIWQESSKSFVHILTNSSGVANSNLAVQSYANVSVGNVLLINNAGIYVDGTLGTAGQVLASDGSKSYWAPPGGFTGGTVAGVTIFQSNLVVSNTTTSTSDVTGALVVRGGAGIAGNVYADALRTTTGIYWAGNGNPIAGITYTASASSPAGPSKGDQWYDTVNDILYEYIFDGTSSYWVDIQTSVIAANASTAITDSINANIGAFYTYANTKIGTNTNSNLVVAATTASASNTTGALVVGGGVGITGNINLTYNPTSAVGAAIQLTGKDTQGSTGWFDFLKATNTTSGATNPNKSIRLNSTGGLEIINSAYTTTLLSLSDAGVLNVSGSYQVAGKQAVNGPAFRAYIAGSQTITSGSQQKVTFGSETFDTNTNFASSTFTPTVEGYYQLNATVRISGSSGTGEIMLTIWKNGSEYARGTNEQGTEQGNNFYSMQVSDLAYANGSTDYFEIYIQQTSGGNRDTTAGQNISYFSGCMVRGA